MKLEIGQRIILKDDACIFPYTSSTMQCTIGSIEGNDHFYILEDNMRNIQHASYILGVQIPTFDVGDIVTLWHYPTSINGHKAKPYIREWGIITEINHILYFVSLKGQSKGKACGFNLSALKEKNYVAIKSNGFYLDKNNLTYNVLSI